MNNIVLVDGNNNLYRAIFTQDSLYNSNNEFTGGVFGFLRIIHSIKSLGDIIVCFDGQRASSYRRKIYPEYKTNRLKPEIEKTEEDRIIEYKKSISINQSIEACSILGIPYVMINGIEADDIIYTLTRYFSNKGNKVIVVSGDNDFLQLLSIKNTTIYQPIKDLFIEEKEFIEKYGYKSNCSILAKCLQGDPSDNIKGVKGIGPKTITKIMNEIPNPPSIENIINWSNIGKPSKAKKVLSESKELLELNSKLIDLSKSELNQSRILNKSLRSIFSSEKDFKKTVELFKYHGFNVLNEMLYSTYFFKENHEDIIL